tara:strand:+ start:385 stop:1032 length:648 start_codon:yes stop_codon:yes gene_type:complete
MNNYFVIFNGEGELVSYLSKKDAALCSDIKSYPAPKGFIPGTDSCQKDENDDILLIKNGLEKINKEKEHYAFTERASDILVEFSKSIELRTFKVLLNGKEFEITNTFKFRQMIGEQKDVLSYKILTTPDEKFLYLHEKSGSILELSVNDLSTIHLMLVDIATNIFVFTDEKIKTTNSTIMSDNNFNRKKFKELINISKNEILEYKNKITDLSRVR